VPIEFDLRRLKAYRRVLPIVGNDVTTALALTLGSYEQAAEVESQMASHVAVS